MAETYWLSRKPKYNQVEIFRIAFNYVLAKNLKSAKPCLELCARNNHQEAIFLLECIESAKSNTNAQDGDSYNDNIFIHIKDARAIKYKWWFSSWYSFGPRDVDRLKETLDEEEPMMLHVLGMTYEIWGKQEEAVEYYRKAAAKDFTPSMYKLSQLVFGSKTKRLAGTEKEAATFLLRAAQLGNALALKDLFDIIMGPYRYSKSYAQLFDFDFLTGLKFRVLACLHGDFEVTVTILDTINMYSAQPRMSSPILEEAVSIYFTCGRVFGCIGK